jgi:hypothetical protein
LTMQTFVLILACFQLQPTLHKTLVSTGHLITERVAPLKNHVPM